MGKLCCKEAPIRATTRPVVEIEGFTSVDEVKKWRRDATLLFKCFKLDEKIIINRRGANAIVFVRIKIIGLMLASNEERKDV